jgi:hypothetical protein
VRERTDKTENTSIAAAERADSSPAPISALANEMNLV